MKLKLVAVPDAVFTSDDGPVQTSYDTPVIDLTEAGPEVVAAPPEADIEDTVIDLGDSASDSLSQGGTRVLLRTRGFGHVCCSNAECCHAACQSWGLMHWNLAFTTGKK